MLTKNEVLTFKGKWANLERKTAILSLPLQLEFLATNMQSFANCGSVEKWAKINLKIPGSLPGPGEKLFVNFRYLR